MKKLALSLGLVLLSSSAFAGTKIISCVNDDASTTVDLYRNSGGSLVAVVATEGAGDSMPEFKYRVIEKQGKQMGAPLSYVGGSKFLLSLIIDAAPSKLGITSRLKVTDLEIKTDVRCRLYR